MEANAPRGLLRFFDDLQDPRPGHNVMHRLDDLLAIAILAVLCGAESWVDVAIFGRCQRGWLKTFLVLPHGVPSHDTFGRVLGAIQPEAFERCFLNWTSALAQHGGGRLIAIDGKTLRRSFDRASTKAAIHMVSAWCEANHLVLGQLATEAKSNEITAIPKLLELLDLTDAVVTIDAMGCQMKIAQQIIDQGGDYVLGLKGNQGTLHQDVKRLFDEAIADGFDGLPHAYHETIEKGHGRIETRRLWCTRQVDDFEKHHGWPGLRSVVCVECTRDVNAKRSTERRYYISRLGGHDAQAMLHAVRGHWGIENRVHWCLDVSFREDESRIRHAHGAENFSRLRRLAVNLLRRDQTFKVGLRAKSKACGWDHQYLMNVLTA